MRNKTDRVHSFWLRLAGKKQQSSIIPVIVINKRNKYNGKDNLRAVPEREDVDSMRWKSGQASASAWRTALPYEPISRSCLLPDLEIELIGRGVLIYSWQQARRTLRSGFGGRL
jgi:hypothetical protein